MMVGHLYPRAPKSLVGLVYSKFQCHVGLDFYINRDTDMYT